jgi:hypothetical protein
MYRRTLVPKTVTTPFAKHMDAKIYIFSAPTTLGSFVNQLFTET